MRKRYHAIRRSATHSGEAKVRGLFSGISGPLGYQASNLSVLSEVINVDVSGEL